HHAAPVGLPQLTRQRVEAIAPPRPQHQIGAVRREPPRAGAADPRAGARDQRALPGETTHGSGAPTMRLPMAPVAKRPPGSTLFTRATVATGTGPGYRRANSTTVMACGRVTIWTRQGWTARTAGSVSRSKLVVARQATSRTPGHPVCVAMARIW